MQEKQQELLTHSLNLLSVKDPMAFQAVAAMTTQTQVYSDEYIDPSDAAEALRMEEQGRLNGTEQQALADLGFRPEQLGFGS
jgi:hypothetical protein